MYLAKVKTYAPMTATAKQTFSNLQAKPKLEEYTTLSPLPVPKPLLPYPERELDAPVPRGV